MKKDKLVLLKIKLTLISSMVIYLTIFLAYMAFKEPYGISWDAVAIALFLIAVQGFYIFALIDGFIELLNQGESSQTCDATDVQSELQQPETQKLIAENETLRKQVEEKDKEIAELKRDRDYWKSLAEAGMKTIRKDLT